MNDLEFVIFYLGFVTNPRRVPPLEISAWCLALSKTDWPSYWTYEDVIQYLHDTQTVFVWR